MTSEDIIVGTQIRIGEIPYLVLRFGKSISIVKDKQPPWLGSNNILMQYFVQDVTQNEAGFYFCTEEWAILRKKESGTIYSLNLLWKIRTADEHLQEANNE